MNKSIIEFCEINLENGSRSCKYTLEEDINLDVKGYGCLHNCQTCDRYLYAVVDGEIIAGETSKELVKNIYEHLEDERT